MEPAAPCRTFRCRSPSAQCAPLAGAGLRPPLPAPAARGGGRDGHGGQDLGGLFPAPPVRGARHRAAYLGTLGLVTPEGADYGGLTSPGPEDLHPLLDRLAGEGITHLAVEASSHGLDQYRMDGLTLAAGGFTNLGRDHLDYHPTIEAYYRAKLRLFTELLPAGAPRWPILAPLMAH